MQARRSVVAGAALLSLLLLGMTLGLRVRPLPARSLSLVTSQHTAPVRSRPPVLAAGKRAVRLATARRAPAFSSFAAAAAADAPKVETTEVPVVDADSTPLESTVRRDISALASPDYLTMSRPQLAASARPASLTPLYGTFAALQAADLITTIKALEKPGLREANPVVRPFARNVPAMIAVKGVSTFVTVAAVEKLWRKNRVAAVATMVGINVAYGIVVSHNAAALQ